MTTEPTPETERVLVDATDLPTVIVEEFLVTPVRVRYANDETDWAIGVVAYDHDAAEQVQKAEAGQLAKPSIVLTLDGRMAVELANDLLNTYLDGPPKGES